MKNSKKIISLFMSLIMSLSMFAVIDISSFAEDDILSYLTYEINDGEVTITHCDTSISGDVVLPNTIDGYPLVGIAWNAFDYCINLTGITIPNGVQTIEWWAFHDCINLKTIIIPDSVTNIGHSAFSKTAYYEDETNWENGILYIANHLIRAKTDIAECKIKDGTLVVAESAFEECVALTNVEFPKSVTNIGENAFRACIELKNITLPKSVVNIEAMSFQNCKKLTNVVLSDGLKNIGYQAFTDCTSLKSISIPESVTSIGEYAFGYAYNPNFSNNTVMIDFKINGVSGSVAEEYAKENGINFVEIGEEPTTEEPTTEEPTTEEPTTEEPTTEEPTTEEPTTEKPTTEVPITHEPSTDKPTVDESDNKTELTVKNGSGITVDYENKIVQVGTESSADISSLIENENIRIVDINDDVLNNDALVGTGSKIQILDNNGNVVNKYIIIVPSDVDGNGKTTAADARMVLRSSAKLDNLDGVYATAANINKDDKITAADARTILRISAKLETLSL